MRINKLITHPTLPIAISAHEDKSIKFYDTTSGQIVHSMVAHLDSVTSLAVDPNGLYLLSGSKSATTPTTYLLNKTKFSLIMILGYIA